jgi:hypothetical protein
MFIVTLKEQSENYEFKIDHPENPSNISNPINAEVIEPFLKETAKINNTSVKKPIDDICKTINVKTIMFDACTNVITSSKLFSMISVK